MKKAAACIGAIFACEDCGARFEAYKNAQACAAKHAKHYGHRVTGEVTIYNIYDAREPGEGGAV